MVTRFSPLFKITGLILYCIFQMEANALGICNFKERKIIFAPDECCIINRDLGREILGSIFQFPMKADYLGRELSEVTRTQANDNVTNYYFGGKGEQDIIHTYLQVENRYRICYPTNTSLSLNTLPLQSAKNLSNCGTDIIFKRSQLNNKCEYMKLCKLIGEVPINVTELREMDTIKTTYRKPEQDDCPASNFHCNNNRCLPLSWRCDGEDDCGDTSDEQECEKDVKCGSYYFRCGDGSCVANTSICNGFSDCSDDADEQNCDRGADHCTWRGDFRCGDGICVPRKLLCDGDEDCGDGSDEMNCFESDHCTPRGQFRCQDSGKCVDMPLLCDQTNDCEDGSDENNCMSRDFCELHGRYYCGNGWCIANTLICDDKHDCSDGSDEYNCTGIDYCTSRHLYHCPDTGKCISFDRLCNGISDCKDGSDEKYCASRDFCKGTGRFRCGNGQCISNTFVCDDKYECKDGSDEYNCTEIFVHAPKLKNLKTEFKTFVKITYSNETLKSLTNIEIHNNVVYIEWVIIKAAKFHQLKHLDISRSEICHASTINVTNILIKSVEILNLSYCQITNLDLIPLKAFPSLKYLDLRNNNIKNFKPDTFSNMQNILKLNLAMSFDRKAIVLHLNTKNMKFLDLSNNKLEAVRLQLRGEANVLDMSNIKLQEVELHLDGNINLLNVSYNKLKHSTVKVVSSAKSSVKYLDLKRNRMKLSGQLFENLKGVLTVDVEDYRLDCTDCPTLVSDSLQNVLRNKSDIMVIYDSADNIPLCTSPEEHLGDMFENVNLCSGFEEQIRTTYLKITLTAAGVIIVLLVLVVTGIGYKYRFEISYWIQYVKLKKRKLASCFCDADGYEYDAFISYCAADRRWVWTVLRPGLEESLEKYRLCLHERDFLLGSQIKENIDNSMRTSRYCIMILSNDFIESQWCRFELEHAGYKLIEDKREFLIIIELEPLDTTDVPPHLKQLIETRTYLEWNLEKFAEEALLDRLKSALGQSIFQKNMQSRVEQGYFDSRI